MIENITGIILAGGESQRMGVNKSFVLFSGRPLVEIVIGRLSSLFAELIIITNQPHLYKRYGIKTETDILTGCGALGGIYTGLLSSANMYNFIAACDMPFINQDLVRYLIGGIEDNDVVIAKHNARFQPLCAVYSKNCSEPIKQQLFRQNLKITSFFKQVRVKIVTEKEIAKFDADGFCFVNLNTPADCRRFEYERIKN